MNKSKIEWCDMTWNPVTGCFNNCEYCYARKIANRFGGASETHCNETVGVECQWCTESDGKAHELEEPIYDVDRGVNAPYPFEFDPTLHRYRFDEPRKIKEPQNVFVCSMADLFGDWVPDEWIDDVLIACTLAPQHRYIFLTKNPFKYVKFQNDFAFQNKNRNWYGTTVTSNKDNYSVLDLIFADRVINKFVSIEPLQQKLHISTLSNIGFMKWVIIGAETGNRKGKVIPEKEWIDDIVEVCTKAKIPVFMKNSLVPIMGEDNMLREMPEGLMK